jgi:hypothetical protein
MLSLKSIMTNLSIDDHMKQWSELKTISKLFD